MFTKFIGLVIVAALCVLGIHTVADAQSPPSPRTAPRAINLEALHPGNRAELGTTNATGTTEATIHPDFVIGWNYIHPMNCQAYYYGGYYYFLVHALEGGYFYTTDIRWQNTLAPACQTGYWVAFHVYDAFNDWDQIYTYTYR
jgi:hypothetical protein